jgi:hypothetical protein
MIASEKITHMESSTPRGLSPTGVLASSLGGEVSRHRRGAFSVQMAVLALILVLGALVVSLRAYSAKVWLMDDFRAGYSAGTELGPVEGDAYGACTHLAEDSYGERLMYTEPGQAFAVGCSRALAGRGNDYWGIADYLED